MQCMQYTAMRLNANAIRMIVARCEVGRSFCHLFGSLYLFVSVLLGHNMNFITLTKTSVALFSFSGVGFWYSRGSTETQDNKGAMRATEQDLRNTIDFPYIH